jgi:hypothetical protein
MKNKTNKISITQENGIVKIYRNEELEKSYDFNRNLTFENGSTVIGFANMIAEIINDCLNCKTATSSVTDLNDTKSYRGTYFEFIDQFDC